MRYTEERLHKEATSLTVTTTDRSDGMLKLGLHLRGRVLVGGGLLIELAVPNTFYLVVLIVVGVEIQLRSILIAFL